MGICILQVVFMRYIVMKGFARALVDSGIIAVFLFYCKECLRFASMRNSKVNKALTNLNALLTDDSVSKFIV